MDHFPYHLGKPFVQSDVQFGLFPINTSLCHFKNISYSPNIFKNYQKMGLHLQIQVCKPCSIWEINSQCIQYSEFAQFTKHRLLGVNQCLYTKHSHYSIFSGFRFFKILNQSCSLNEANFVSAEDIYIIFLFGEVQLMIM